MADDPSSIPGGSPLPEPEKTGSTADSQTPSVTVLPAISQDDRKGLQGSTVLWPALEAFLSQGTQQMTEFSKVFLADYERRFNCANKSIENLQDKLRQEEVAHARTQARLAAILEKDRKSMFITAIGGVLLGLGVKEFETDHGKLFAGIGLVLLIVGCWSLLPKIKN